MIDRRLFIAGAAGFMMAPANAARPFGPGVVELRQYTLKGGTRAAFIRLFEREFVASQNAVGSQVLGVFEDLDDPDRFVWMRGFRDMAVRKAALEAFYFGTVWKAHRDEANGMMVDSDNVLLLAPLTGAMDKKTLSSNGVVRVAIHRLRGAEPADFASFFGSRMMPQIRSSGGTVLATLVTERSENDFPRLPVRADDTVFIWITGFPNEASEQNFTSRLQAASGWRDGIPEALLPALMQKPEVLRLASSIALVDGH